MEGGTDSEMEWSMVLKWGWNLDWQRDGGDGGGSFLC